MTELKENQVLHGFRVTRIRRAQDYDAPLIEMVHEKTGAELVWLARKDENKTFCIGFKTIPWNDTGVFHICEHSVLNGSTKYPVREPFVDLLKTSMQTFLNAMTYPDKTIYPISSRNPKDFLNLMDVYLDAVLHPMIYHNPNIFYQEGWHYEIHSADEDPVYKGVVFNEMKGAFSSMDEVVVNEINRTLYPDNCYQYVSGGDPEKIPELSYEAFLKAHAKFYHPSNARVFLDGNLDIDAALEKINSFFAPYEKETVDFSIPMQSAVPSQVRNFACEIGENENIAHRSQIALARVLCDFRDVKTQLAWQALSKVLAGSNDSPLKKAVLDAGLGEDVSLDVMDEIEQPFVVFSVNNTDPEKLNAVRDTVRQTVRKLVREGLDHEELRAVLNQMEFHYREQKEPAGVMLGAAAYRSWMYEGDPLLYLSAGSYFEELRQSADQGYFEQALQDVLLDEEHNCWFVCVPDKALAKERVQKEAQRLHDAKLSWKDSVSDYIVLNRKLEEWQAGEDSEEVRTCLPRLALSDVDPLPLRYEGKEESVHGVPVLVYPDTGSGIVYLNLYFNLAGIREDMLSEAAFFADTLSSLKTQDHSLRDLQREISRDLGTLSFNTDAFCSLEDPTAATPVLSVSCSVLKKNVEKAVDLILEILCRTVFEKDPVLAIAKQDVEMFRQAMISGGSAFAIRRAGAHHSAENAAREFMSGYESGRWLKKTTENWDACQEDVLADFAMFREVLFDSSRLSASISGEENVSTVKRLIEALPSGNAHRDSRVHYPLLKDRKEGIPVSSQVSYAANAVNLKEAGGDYNGALRVAAHILTYGYLWSEVRVKGGAYGTGFTASPGGTVSCYSYRDPTPGKSLETFSGCADAIRAAAEDPENLVSNIIGTIAAGEPLLTPGQKIRSADTRWFTGMDWQHRVRLRKEMLTTSPEDLRALADVYEKACENVTTCIVGAESALKEDPESKILVN